MRQVSQSRRGGAQRIGDAKGVERAARAVRVAWGRTNGRMIGTTAAAKLKVSLSLSAEVLALVDRTARRGNDTRSGVIERWLRRAATAAVEQEIADATAAYYRSLRGDELAEDEALSRGLSDAARRVSYDDAPAPRARRARR